MAAPLVIFVACGGSTNDGSAAAGSGGAAGGPIIIVGGGSGGSAGSGGGVIVDGDAACVAEPRAGEQIPLDLFFMVDKSGSMGCAVGAAGAGCTNGSSPPPGVTRWTSIRDALTTFAASSASSGLGAGIGFFPQMNGGTLLCAAQDYATPAAPIAGLPGSSAALSAALGAQMPNGNTPTVPALSGALSYVTSYAQAHRGRTVAVVFATDGEPTQCTSSNNTIAGAVRVAAAAAAGTPPIKTYVLGVGPSLNNLNQIAQAGGSGQAYLVESGGSQDLLAALNSIRKSALSCDYSIPVFPGKPLDFSAVNVRVKVGATGDEKLITKVDSPAACGATGGWYYDDNSAPTRITLCPTICDPMVATAGSTLTVLIGCRSVIIPPD
jgi:hypothetical protein